MDQDLQFGYITPGHGKKGKQVVISSDKDLAEMYDHHGKKTEILLWIKQSRKKPRLESNADSSRSSSSKYEVQVDKMTNIDELCEKLTAIHESNYTKEQIRAWAILIQMGKHDNYNSPPDKRFFMNGRKSTHEVSVGVSPGKKLSMRSECIDQLDKWYCLMEKGVIDAEQYKAIQDNIMRDIKKV